MYEFLFLFFSGEVYHKTNPKIAEELLS